MSRSLGACARAALAVALIAAAVAVVPAAPASAALTATLGDLTLPAVPYSFGAQTVSREVALTVVDSTSEGWNVTLVATPLTYNGDYGGADIPAANLAITSLQAPVAADGLSEDVDPVGGPKVPQGIALPASLDTPRAVLEAEVNNGTGTYTQDMTLSLIVPGGARAGTYTGIITTTISPGPIPS